MFALYKFILWSVYPFVGLAIASFLGVVGLFFVFQKNFVWRKISKKELRGKTYLIFGASLGLGKSLSTQLAKNEPKKLILVSRGSTTKFGKSALEELEKELKPFCIEVQIVKLDICNLKQVSDYFKQSKEEKIDWIIVNAGICLPKLLLGQDLSFDNKEEEAQINLNYFGALNITKALLASKFRPERLVFVGSLVLAGSFSGYSGYGASKYALKGLVDSIRNEFKCYKTSNRMNVHLYVPGSIDSPGYENENKLKPEVTKKIEGTVKLVDCENASKILIRGVLSNTYLIPTDFVGYLAATSINGLTPRKHVFLESIALPLIGIITHFVARDFDNNAEKELSSRRKE